MGSWSEYVQTLETGLNGLVVTDQSGAEVAPMAAVARWVEMTQATHDRGRYLYIIGNGGSAGMASHMAADACKNGHLRALAFNDPALLTATANDLAYDQVFSVPIQRLALVGDLLVSISSSGNSPNIVAALGAARAIGVQTVTLSGMGADNRSRRLGDLNFYVPLARYGWVESAHQVILHYWFDRYLDAHRSGAI